MGSLLACGCGFFWHDGDMKNTLCALMMWSAAVTPLALAPTAMANPLRDTATKKVAITHTVLQKHERGLLMNARNPFLLVGHPDEARLADGDRVNVYATRTDHLVEYIDTTGAKRTVRVWRFANRRIGR